MRKSAADSASFRRQTISHLINDLARVKVTLLLIEILFVALIQGAGLSIWASEITIGHGIRALSFAGCIFLFLQNNNLRQSKRNMRSLRTIARVAIMLGSFPFYPTHTFQESKLSYLYSYNKEQSSKVDDSVVPTAI